MRTAMCTWMDLRAFALAAILVLWAGGTEPNEPLGPDPTPVALDPDELAQIAQISYATGAAMAGALEFHRSRIDDPDALCRKMFKVAATNPEELRDMMAYSTDEAIEPVLEGHYRAFVALLALEVECDAAFQLAEGL